MPRFSRPALGLSLSSITGWCEMIKLHDYKAKVAGIATTCRGSAANGTISWFCAVLLSGVSAFAQPPHPRVWITQADLPRLRAFASDTTVGPLGFAPAEAFADVRERADEFLKEPTFVYRVNMPGKGGGPAKEWSYTLSDEAPPKHDDYPHYPCWTGMSRQIETRIIHLSFAHLTTQHRPYFDRAKQMDFRRRGRRRRAGR